MRRRPNWSEQPERDLLPRARPPSSGEGHGRRSGRLAMPASPSEKPQSWPIKLVRLLPLAAAQAAEAAAREAALKAEQEARDAEFAEQIARETALEAERQAARDDRYAARKARKRKGR